MLIRNVDPASDLHIDFVPMVDVLFNLLIFFLLATSMAQSEREMSIALPQAVASGPISAAMREIVININADGSITLAGKSTTTDELAATIRAAVASNPDQKVSIRGDRNTSYANVASVLDVCKGAGIQQPYLETIPTR
ncbi:MAG: biopolymer transporter ExbD [Planctomycetota bacterium]